MSMNLSSPWINYYREINALFGCDNEVKVLWYDAEKEIKIFVQNGRKADAIASLLPTSKVFGNVEVKVTVVPANSNSVDAVTAVEEAFSGNPALSYIYDAMTPFGKFCYVVFKKEVVQYYNDDLGDIHGNRSTLYQDIAKDVIDVGGLLFCTDTGDNKFEKPFAEW